MITERYLTIAILLLLFIVMSAISWIDDNKSRDADRRIITKACIAILTIVSIGLIAVITFYLIQ
ncbi:hypothetical protein EZS27_012338 [termite gut metagenome]|uniref:Uncharacterized protein n=1 Tax=termite gut metagenome TaxID=433724 RepID=A0A5J4S2S7_9ZZZZ